MVYTSSSRWFLALKHSKKTVCRQQNDDKQAAIGKSPIGKDNIGVLCPSEFRFGNQVGREFVRLYYKVMNSYSAYLYLFYEQDSTVVISESRDDDKPLSMQATTREVPKIDTSPILGRQTL